MKRIAIIPARGGSKRLPKKNILPVNGKPMLAYPVATALQSKLFDEVVVSTEDREIADIATNAGASVVLRPENLAQDHSTVVHVCNHILSLPEHSTIDSFCCIYATAVLLQWQDLHNSLLLMEEEPKANFVMGVSSYNYQPMQALKTSAGFLTPMWPEYKNMQSQLYPKLVASNGTFYWARKQPFIDASSFYGSRLKGYDIPAERAIDIDTLEDYKKIKNIVAEKEVEEK